MIDVLAVGIRMTAGAILLGASGLGGLGGLVACGLGGLGDVRRRLIAFLEGVGVSGLHRLGDNRLGEQPAG